MFRKDLIDLLLDNPLSVFRLAQLLDEPPGDVEDALQHVHKSLKHSPYRMVVVPARCRKCGFAFRADKLRKPGKCPVCRGTWISEPRVRIENTGAGHD